VLEFTYQRIILHYTNETLFAFKTLKGGKPANCSRTIRITSYYYFLSVKTWFYTLICIAKLCGPFYSTSRKMFLVHPASLNFDLLCSYATFCEKCLLAVPLQTRLHCMHENWYMIRPWLAEDTALSCCVFDDPSESYCPWHFIIFT
jgi:hypothetical protein